MLFMLSFLHQHNASNYYTTATNILPHETLFLNNENVINIDALTHHLNITGRLSLDDVCYLLKPNMLLLKDPITICGDIHGQFFSLLNITQPANPSNTQYLFLGNYINIVYSSLECIFYLCAYK
eukprot:210143_1